MEKEKRFVFRESDVAFILESIAEAKELIAKARIAGVSKAISLIMLESSMQRIENKYKPS